MLGLAPFWTESFWSNKLLCGLKVVNREALQQTYQMKRAVTADEFHHQRQKAHHG